MREHRAPVLMVLLVAVLLAGSSAACSDDDDGGTTTTTSDGGPADGPSSGGLPPSTSFPLDGRRTVKITDAEGVVSYGDGEFDEILFGTPTGSVDAVWYRVGDRWAVHFRGLSPEQANGRCLAVFEPFGSEGSRPYGAGACDDVPADAILPAGSLLLCDDAIILISDLTTDAPTALGARVVQQLGDGESQELWGFGDVGNVPTIDVADCEAIS